MKGKGVCYCSVCVAASWVDDDVGRLIDDDYVVVFVDYVEGYVLRGDFGFRQLGQSYLYEVASVEL